MYVYVVNDYDRTIARSNVGCQCRCCRRRHRHQREKFTTPAAACSNSRSITVLVYQVHRMRANANALSNRAALTPPSSPNHYTAISMLTIHRPDPMMLNDNWYYKLCRHWKNNPFPYHGQHGRRRRQQNVERYDTVSTEHTATRHDRCYVDVT